MSCKQPPTPIEKTDVRKKIRYPFPNVFRNGSRSFLEWRANEYEKKRAIIMSAIERKIGTKTVGYHGNDIRDKGKRLNDSKTVRYFDIRLLIIQ